MQLIISTAFSIEAFVIQKIVYKEALNCNKNKFDDCNIGAQIFIFSNIGTFSAIKKIKIHIYLLIEYLHSLIYIN